MYQSELYALVHTGTPGDEAFYGELARGQRVLELGVGFGRLLPTLAAAASHYSGIERDAGMLALAEQQRAQLPESLRAHTTLVDGDMRDFTLGQHFDRIFIPHSGLWCLTGDDDVERCLERVVAHLAPGGQLVLDAYHADPFHEQSRPEDVADEHEEPVAQVHYRGRDYDVLERSHWDRDAQRMDVHYRHVPRDGGAIEDGTIEHRYLLCDQLATALVQVGLEDLCFSGDFDGSPIDDQDLLVVHASR